MRTASDVRNTLPTVAVVPTLGPVEDREEVLSSGHVKENMGTKLSSRHFRNQLYFLRLEERAEFDELRGFILSNTPEITDLRLADNISPGEHSVDLFVTETTGRTEREIAWLGDGMQVWLQVLYHIWFNRRASTLVLDEPDVYLHPDLQRRLVGIADDLPGQTVMATHAPEILTEIGRESVVWVDRSRSTSQRMRDSKALDRMNARLGSGFNLGMARALRSRAVLFVEGDDMKILRSLAGTLGADQVKKERGLAVIPLDGFSNWHQVEPFAWLSRDLLGDAVTIHVFLDSDYRTEAVIHDLEATLRARNVKVHVWRRKELESYLLVPEAIARVSGLDVGRVSTLIGSHSELLRHSAQVGFVGRRQKDADRHIDPQTVMREALIEFDALWLSMDAQLTLVPPKEMLSALSRECKDGGGRSFSPRTLAAALKPTEIAGEMADEIIAVERSLGSVIA